MEQFQQEKLDRFVNSVNGEVDVQISGMLREAEKEGEAIKSSAKDDALKASYDRIQKAVKDTEAQYKRMIAQAEQEHHRSLLSHREALVEKIFDNIRKRLVQFRQSEDYPAYLQKQLRDVKLSADSIIYLAPADMQYADLLKGSSGAQVCEDDSIQLGGLSITAKDSKCIMDKTLDTAFDEQRKAFSTTYHLGE
ncbi:V-type ATP synthase subunit E [Ruminococcus sp.]|uniref:V-type ATP synthase subunit E n=1 Tax=Ruminococcus sp. TaxID=41978 RepID=UPI0025F14E94|nr:V-type ATP synthase subunit E [Ruminococcus sp.]MCI5816090.1 V-type ATP synthase subunit E [Ruminococcus sp.]MDD7556441.1 V-type ATP synthase subunit E [Ruminococcus sp.]MDY4964718.1 V-type ATP synthase subunit E [Ruminococcus callidus]